MVGFKAGNSVVKTDSDKKARKEDTEQDRDVKTMLEEIGEDYDALAEFKDSFEDVS